MGEQQELTLDPETVLVSTRPTVEISPDLLSKLLTQSLLPEELLAMASYTTPEQP